MVVADFQKLRDRRDPGAQEVRQQRERDHDQRDCGDPLPARAGDPFQPGALADMVSLFTKEGLNIAYLYTFLLKDKPIMVFRTDDAAKAKGILESGGLCCFKW